MTAHQPTRLRACTSLSPAAHHPPARVIDLTTQPAPAAAFVHVSFGLNVWNPQLTLATFNKPGMRALFVQSIKNLAPGGWEGGLLLQGAPCCINRSGAVMLAHALHVDMQPSLPP